MRYLTFLVALLPCLAFGQLDSPKIIDFEFINQEKSAVPKNSRLELGVTLPDSILELIQVYMDGIPNQREGLNPFMSWDIDVKAHFTHIKSQSKFAAIGFWFTDVERNQEKNKWIQLETDHQFRIRYAPTNIGEYRVHISVLINKKLAYVSDEDFFTVVDSDFKGFVSLNDSTEYLQRDGETIIPTGINLSFPSNNNNLIYSLSKTETLDLAVWESFNKSVKDYVTEGGEYFRFFMHPSVSDIEFEEVGFYQDRQNLAWEMDQMISFCEANNTLIQFNLMYHSYFMKLGDYYQFRYDYANYWLDEKSPYKDPNLPSGYSAMLNSDTPSDMFLKEEGMRYLKQRTRYIVARWGYSTSLSAIELLCEPWHINENSSKGESPYDAISESGDVARKAVYEYHKQIGSYIKDTIQYNNHLLAGVGRFPVGKTAIYSHLTEETPGFVDSTWYLDDLDFLSISYYSRSPEKLIHSKSSSNNEFGSEENSMAKTIERLKKTYNKPVLFGESDHGDGTHECSDYQGHKIDVMRYPFTGAIGHFIWAAFLHSEEERNVEGAKDERVSWPDIIDAKNYYNSNWFLEIINNKTALGREKSSFSSSEKDIVEHQYIIGKDHEIAAGYVYNRTFNVQTAGASKEEGLKENACDQLDAGYTNPTVISWRPNRMKVEGLKSFSKYRVLYYGYSDQSLLLQAELRTSLFGKLKLTHPLLVPEKSKTPLLWYRVEKMN
ncbi:hypothetical protein ERX46_02595 [Brumimicrobium glaciale]|uniref:DUF5060 domain-containing protein n=1 Tax=Brumimicrobium glaciale TaxID=200475 RepID=A0A4Q4KT51_9FLAO|nr:hypothetical protein [Brumimicrobium glaciale]RYM35899.1 hypothetical protein ERX46_02595 [Brumimicrobium glaciale]